MRGVFVIKIIYNKDKDLRLIEDALDNNLDNLHFYIPKKLQGSFYCRLVDSNDFESILKLSKSDSSDKLYNIYKVSLDNFIACANGDMKLSILFIENDLPHISNNIQINLNCDNMKSIAQLYYIDSVTMEIINKYKKIVQLTEMNINIYKDIQEVMNK
jgi:hypothetical protein